MIMPAAPERYPAQKSALMADEGEEGSLAGGVKSRQPHKQPHVAQLCTSHSERSEPLDREAEICQNKVRHFRH